jgi:ribosome-associated translation inhibitor RaiA
MFHRHNKEHSMQVQVNTDDHIQGGDSLAQWISDECKSRLSRFQDHVTRLEVYLSDLDAGKSGANDKRCRIEARVTGRQPVTVSDDSDKMATAFIGASDKLARALDADLGRLKDRHGRDTIRTAVEE